MRVRRLIQVGFLALLAIPACAQQPVRSIADEVRRLQSLAQQQPSDDASWNDVKPSVTQYLKRAQDALDAGRQYYAIESLGHASDLLDSYLNTKQDPETFKKGMEGFEAHWNEAHVELTAVDAKARTRDWSKSPLVLRALSEAAQGQSMTLLEASRAYANVTNTTAGYFYVGEARASADFATYCHSLQLRRTGPMRSPRSILPELTSLQAETNKLFQPPLSIEKHSDFIRLNATLKLAGELDAANLHAGALFEYLFALQQLGLLEARTIPRAEDLKALLSDARHQVKESKEDDSVAELFLEKAEALLAPNSNLLGSEDLNLRTAGVLLQRVLSAYYAYWSALPSTQPTGKETVTVTLVRWPYT